MIILEKLTFYFPIKKTSIFEFITLIWHYRVLFISSYLLWLLFYNLKYSAGMLLNAGARCRQTRNRFLRVPVEVHARNVILQWVTTRQ